MLLIALLEIFDAKLKTEDDLKHCCNYPILTIVPDMNEASKRGYYKKPTQNAEDEQEKKPAKKTAAKKTAKKTGGKKP